MPSETNARGHARSDLPVFEANPASPAEAAPPDVDQALHERRPATNRLRARIAVAALALGEGAIAGVLAWRALRTADAPAQLLPLASYSGVEGPPALSPDGELVAFAWSGDAEDGPTDIYVKTVGSEALRRLTATPNRETSPAWSPDGQSIAFVRDGQAVFSMSQLGGAERQVSASGTYVTWAADSKSVLVRDRERNTGPSGIHQVFLDTLERVRLTQAPVGDGDWRFEVSPDGKTLAFIRYEKRGNADLYVVPMRGGEPRRLSNWNASLTGLSWTPDGREIVYSVDEPAAGRLWRIHANSARSGRGTPIADIPAAAANPSISRPLPGEPARLAFQTTARDVDLQMIDLEARTEPSIDGVPSWSGDGQSIYFASTRAGVIPDIWRVSANGGQAVRLTHNGGFEPRESPDGRYVFYLDRAPASLASDGNARLMRVPVAGGQEEMVLERGRPFSVVGYGRGDRVRHPRVGLDAIDLYRFSDQGVARVGRLGSQIPGTYAHMTMSRNGRWAIVTKLVRFESDLMRLDNFR